jgi:hypothetical protein
LDILTDHPSTLKESLFNHDAVDQFAAAIKTAYPSFDTQLFVDQVIDDAWAGRPLMDRLHHVTRVLQPVSGANTCRATTGDH